MPDGRRRTCMECRRHEREVGPISWSGLCGDCGPDRAERAAIELHEHHGEFFDRWRRRLAASVGAIPLDDIERALHTREGAT